MTYVLMYEASNILLLKSNYHQSQMARRSLLVDATLPVQKLLLTYSGTDHSTLTLYHKHSPEAMLRFGR